MTFLLRYFIRTRDNKIAILFGPFLLLSTVPTSLVRGYSGHRKQPIL